MGDDLTFVNAARVSYDKRSEWEVNDYDYTDTGDWNYGQQQMRSRDERLLRFLIENEHTSPFRHAVVQYEVYAPLMVMRQWGKYRVGSVWSFEDSDDPIESWNESSRRYVTEEPTFYIPSGTDSEWRLAPENSKQGSGQGVVSETSVVLESDLLGLIRMGTKMYNDALEWGFCAEQARLFLPAYAMYVRAYWTVSVAGVLHFLQQRLEHDAQWEIQQYAQAVRDLTTPLFPKTFELMGLTDATSHD